ncbi:hypothetical protein PLEOSDRAFT_162943 [Pleurotus ostreatus PC15]|uniref:Uncharacterized protein n=1 Tax=Pleurotus ostreatus (strain PC15) TaxID=1137138 RepID=A0A067N5B4_PLEO1|nr:hypothetical protein PLEOSDRAFT_162943 [Pleurotus ostreatus PC15]
MAPSNNNNKASLRPVTLTPVVDENVSGRARSTIAPSSKSGGKSTNTASANSKPLSATGRLNEFIWPSQRTPTATSAEKSADGGDKTSRGKTKERGENVRTSPAVQTAGISTYKQVEPPDQALIASVNIAAGHFECKDGDKMHAKRKAGEDDVNAFACRVGIATKDTCHQTSSPTKRPRGGQTPTTIAGEFTVELGPEVRTYTKIALDIYGCSHCDQIVVGRDKSAHGWHCWKGDAGTRCELCGHVSYDRRKDGLDHHKKWAICGAKRMDYARSLAQLRSAIPRRMRVQAAIERERKNAGAADRSCAAAVHDDEGVVEEDRYHGAYSEDLEGDDGECTDEEGDDGHSAATGGEQEHDVSTPSWDADEVHGIRYEDYILEDRP